MSLIKKKEEKIFDFKKPIVDSNQPKKLLSTKILGLVNKAVGIAMFTQILFLFPNIMFDNQNKLREAENDRVSVAYTNLNKSLEQKDEKEVLINFIKLKEKNNAATDLLSSTMYMLIANHNYDGKFSAEMLKQIKDIEINDKYSGMEKEFKAIKDKTCFILDGICYLSKQYTIHNYEMYSLRNKKIIDRNIYNAEHIKEFREDMKQMMDDRKKSKASQ